MKKVTLKISVLALFLLVAVGAVDAARPAPRYNGVKYVFLFIGDGTSMAQIHGAEAYLAAEYDSNGKPVQPVGEEKLVMTQFPVMGLSTTYDYGSFITDSASAGTALAAGKKTLSGVINKSPDFQTSYITIAELAKQQGKKVAIISSVSLDHATPASFYSKVDSRGDMYNIGLQLASSNFDYFAGGGLKYLNSTPDANYTQTVADALTANGYSYVNDIASFNALTPASGKVVAVNPTLTGGNALPYEIDRKNDVTNNISLAQFTKKGIEMVYDSSNPHGFFMMVEGGKIDWANHANDARAALDDTLAFDDAIAEAVEFAKAHPRETLIVVTADHDCGGMSLGWAGTGYANRFDLLDGQTMSYEAFDAQVAAFKAANKDVNGIYVGPANISDSNEVKNMIEGAFGLDYDSLIAYQQQKLEDAFDAEISGYDRYEPTQYILYGGYKALSVTCTHILNNNAGIGYTSYAHTGIPVPVMAKGKDAYLFEGYYDNTDVAKKLARAMRVYLNN